MTARPQKLVEQKRRGFVSLYKEVASDWKKKDKGEHWWICPLNQMVEDLCQRNRRRDASSIYAKVAVINRVYRTNLHRRVTGKVKFPEFAVAEQFAKAADPAMNRLRSLRSLTAETLPHIVCCHIKLMELVKAITKTWEVSFCSKYLSFHFPQVAPIYDSYASASATELVPAIPVPEGCNEFHEWEYGRHCLRVLQLLATLKSSGVARPNLRILDFVLYSLLPERIRA
jgi:hypothetical protein